MRGFIKQHKKYVNVITMVSSENIVTCHRGTMRQSRQRQEMRDEESLEREVLHFVGSQSNKRLPEGERTGLFLLLSSESASNNPSLVFVINSKSLIYIFQLLDVWIAWRSEGSGGQSLGPGKHQIVDCRGGGSQEPFEIPSTDSPQPAPYLRHNTTASSVFS